MSTSPFAALGDGTRRRILELLVDGEQPVGALVVTLSAQRPISQPAVSQHLRVLRDAGLVRMRSDGTRRLYAIEPAAIDAAATWLTALVDRAPFAQPLDALATEVARGARTRRAAAGDATAETA